MFPGNGIHTVITDLLKVKTDLTQSIVQSPRRLLNQAGARDVVIFHGFYDPYLFLLVPILFSKGVRCYVKPHGSLMRKSLFRGLFKKLLYISCFSIIRPLIIDVLFINSDEAKNSLFSGIVFPNWLDIDYSWNKEKLTNGSRKIGLIGRIDSFHKGIDLFVELMENYSDEINVEFHVYGAGPDVALINRMIKNFPDRVFYYGAYTREDIPKIFRNIDCIALFSRYEGLPTTILEAISCSTPVIASKWCNASDFEQYGVLKQFDSLDSFIQILNEYQFNFLNFQGAYSSYALEPNKERINDYLLSL